jgi:hypothetical protein
VPKRKKAHELTTEQVLRRLFPKPVRKVLKHIAEHASIGESPSKLKGRKNMKRG